MSETPKSRMFGLAAPHQKMGEQWAKSRLGYLHVLVFLVVALLATVWSGAVFAQPAIDINGGTMFNRITFEQPDAPGFLDPRHAFNEFEIAAILRLVRYWNDIIDVPMQSWHNGGPRTLHFRRDPPEVTGTATGGPGGTITFNRDWTHTDDRQSSQIGMNFWEQVVAHEGAHVLGVLFVGFDFTLGAGSTDAAGTFTVTSLGNGPWDQWFTWSNGNPFVVGNTYNYDLNNLILWNAPEGSIVNGDVWAGGTARGVAIHPNIGGAAHPYEPAGNIISYRTYQERDFFTEVELAYWEDMGFTLDRSRFFGASLNRVHSGVIESHAEFFGDGIFGVGLHILTSDDQSLNGTKYALSNSFDPNAAGNTVIQHGNLISRGANGAGIRVEGYNHNITIADGAIVGATGGYFVGPNNAHFDFATGNYYDYATGTPDARGVTRGQGIGVLATMGNGTVLNSHGTIYAAWLHWDASGNAVAVLDANGRHILNDAVYAHSNFAEVNFLSGSRTVGNININVPARFQAGATLSPHTGLAGVYTTQGYVSTLTVHGDLIMDADSTLLVGVGNGGLSDLVMVTGTADIGNIYIDLATVANGTYTILTSQNLLTYTPINPGRITALDTGRGTGVSASTSTSGNNILLTTTVVLLDPNTPLPNDYLAWTGAESNIWTDAPTPTSPIINNWRLGSGSAHFIDGDDVTFNLSGTHSIDIQGSGSGRVVADMHVSGNGQWTFDGNVRGDTVATTLTDATGRLEVDMDRVGSVHLTSGSVFDFTDVVVSGGALGGSGKVIADTVFVFADGILAPSVDAGTPGFGMMIIDGDLVMDYGGTLRVNIDTPNPGTYSDSDRVAVSGTATLGDIFIELESALPVSQLGLTNGTGSSGFTSTSYILLVVGSGLDYIDNSATVLYNGDYLPQYTGLGEREGVLAETEKTQNDQALQLTLQGTTVNTLLTWTGDVNNNWNISMYNWAWEDGQTTSVDVDGNIIVTPNHRDTYFFDGDAVLFDASLFATPSLTRTINLGNALGQSANRVVADMFVTGGYGSWVFNNGNIIGDGEIGNYRDANGNAGSGRLLLDSTFFGTVAFNGDVDFKGGMFVDSGTLQFGTGGTGTIAGNIRNHGNVVFDHSDNKTYANNMSGTGSLTKRDDGILTMTGVQNYTGLTAVEGGTLRLGNSAGVQSSVGAIAIRNGATLRGIENMVTDLNARGSVYNDGGYILDIDALTVQGNLSNFNGGVIVGIKDLTIETTIVTGYHWNKIDIDANTIWFVYNPDGGSGTFVDFVYDGGDWWVDWDYLVWDLPSGIDGLYAIEFTKNPTNPMLGPGGYWWVDGIPAGSLYGDLLNTEDSYIGEIGSITARNVNNAGFFEKIDTMTVHGDFYNRGIAVELGDVSVAGRFENSGDFVNFKMLESNSIVNNGGAIGSTTLGGTMVAQSEILNEEGTIFNIETITAGQLVNRGGEISSIGELNIAGAFTNRTLPTGNAVVFDVKSIQADSLWNSGIMSTIDTITLTNGLVNETNGAIVDVKSFTVGGTAVNNGYMYNISTLTVQGAPGTSNAITNMGYLANIDNIRVETGTFRNQPNGVIAGVSNIATGIGNLGGTFENRGTIYVGDAALRTSQGMPVFDVNGSPILDLKGVGILTIDGDFNSAGGTFVIGVQGEKNSCIDIYGSAAINGGTVEVILINDTNYLVEHEYVFMNADDLTVASPLALLTVSNPLLRAVLGNDDQSYWFSFERAYSFAGVGGSMNQRVVGKYLDDATLYPAGDFEKVLLALQYAQGGGSVGEGAKIREALETAGRYVTPTVDPLLRALDQMSGSIYGTETVSSFQNMNMMHAALSNVVRRDNIAFRPDVRDNLWGMIYGHAGSTKHDGNVNGYRQGFSGLMVGFDRTNELRRRLGLFISAGTGSLSSDLNDRGLTNEFMLGHYFRKDGDIGYVLAQMGVGAHNYDTRRHIVFGYVDPHDFLRPGDPGYDPTHVSDTRYINRTARNKHNAFLATSHFEMGLKYRGGILNLSPFAGLQYTGLLREGFTEIGAGSLNLTTTRADYHAIRPIFGMRFDAHPFRAGYGLASLYGNVAWMYEFEATRRHTEFTARFTEAGVLDGSTFRVLGNDPGRDWVQAGFGLNYDFNPTLRGFAGYDATANSRQVLHSANLGIVRQW